MIDRPLLGAIGALVAAGLVVGAASTLVTNYALGSPGALLVPTIGAAVVAGFVVMALSALGIGAARRLRTSYW